MSKLIRNSYLNPHGKGVLRTSNGKLAVFSSPVRLLYRDVDGEEEIPFDLAITNFWGGFPFPVFGDGSRLNTSNLFYKSSVFDNMPGIDPFAVPVQSGWWALQCFSHRVLDIWFFGKKITAEVTSERKKIADYTYDFRDGSVWVNGEYRGKWDR